jgi:hypothetical protein
MAFESREESESGPQHGSGTRIKGCLFGEAETKVTHLPGAELDGEQSCSTGSDHAGMGGAHRVEDCSEGMEFLQPAAIAFEIVTLKHNRDIGECMLMTRHGTSDGLAEFREDDVLDADGCADRGIELASTQDFPRLCRTGHEDQTKTQENRQPD